MTRALDRRELLRGIGAAAALGMLQGCAHAVRDQASAAGSSKMPTTEPSAAHSPTTALHLEPLQITPDRITRITVCTRPFRAAGPRIEAETLGRQTVVHNYGHGGSGWSLSWGSSALAVDKALATGQRDIAVIGCGALGMTSALLLQRAGAAVTIYAKDLPPNVRSSYATGLWTPDSRICFADQATTAFKAQWQTMARTSFQTYQTLLGLPGFPVEFIDQYAAFDTPRTDRRHDDDSDPRPKFADLQRELIPELMPHGVDFAPGSHPFGPRYLRRNTLMMFNLAVYQRLLLSDFQTNGGKIAIAEFHTPADLARVRQKTLINATGYGARALFDDRTITPVRGQLARLIPEPDVHYGLFYDGVSFVPRRDGWVVQAVGVNDYYGFNDDTTAADRAEAENAVKTIAGLVAPPLDARI